eukprot:1968442-Prymnesium_polylepis.1
MFVAQAAADEAQARLASLREGAPLEARLGELLHRTNTKAADLMRAYDANNNGSIDRAEFRSFVRT